MTWTQTTLNLKDAAGANQPIIAYTDGTNFSFAHPLLDNTGTIIAPATAGLQTTGNTSLSAIATSVAAIPASPATSGRQDTGNTSLGTIATSTGDLDTNLGAKADSAASTDTGTFSLIALFKRLLSTSTTLVTNTTGLATAANQSTATTSLGTIATAVQAATPAGTNIIGALTNGGQVVIGSTVTRPANTTAYVVGQLVANNTVAGSVTYPTIAAARGTNLVSVATRCILKKTGTSLPNAIFRVHFYNAQPTVSNGDGATWLTGSANYLGFFDVTCTQAFTDAAIGVGIPGSGSMMTFTPASGTSNLYFLIEARAAYTPISGEVFTVSLEVN